MPATDTIHHVFMSIRGGLARAVFGIVPPKEVEDIVQETYVRVCQIEKKDQIREPKSFLYKTARNLALDHAKRAETRLAVSVDDADEVGLDGNDGASGDDTFDVVASNEEFAHFCEAVRDLPVQCRRAFVLKKVYGHSLKEIAREMDISESTVANHIAHGVKRCTFFMMQRGMMADGRRDATTTRIGRRKRPSSEVPS